MNAVSFFTEPFSLWRMLLCTRPFPPPRSTLERIVKFAFFALVATVYWLAYGPATLWDHVFCKPLHKWQYIRYLRHGKCMTAQTTFDMPSTATYTSSTSEERPLHTYPPTTTLTRCFQYKINHSQENNGQLIITKHLLNDSSSSHSSGSSSGNDKADNSDKSSSKPLHLDVLVLPGRPRSALPKLYVQQQVDQNTTSWQRCAFLTLQGIFHTLCTAGVLQLYVIHNVPPTQRRQDPNVLFLASFCFCVTVGGGVSLCMALLKPCMIQTTMEQVVHIQYGPSLDSRTN